MPKRRSSQAIKRQETADDIVPNAAIDIGWEHRIVQAQGRRYSLKLERSFWTRIRLKGKDVQTDCMMLLAGTGLRLSKVVSQSSPVHLAHQRVITPWEQKGLVMRTLVENLKDRELVLVDGVKVLEDHGWALVLPDPEQPVTHVWAEGSDDRAASTRADGYASLVRELLR